MCLVYNRAVWYEISILVSIYSKCPSWSLIVAEHILLAERQAEHKYIIYKMV